MASGKNKDGSKRKTRMVSYTDAILEINQGFIKPMQEYLGDKWSWEDTIRLVFNADRRDVLFCRAIRDFEIDGRYVHSPEGNKVVRRVNKGDALIVRTDATRPSHNEVLFRDQYFLLGQVQIAVIKHNLEVIL